MSHPRATQYLPSALLALVLHASAVLGSPAAAETWESIPPNPNVDIVYIPPKSSEWQGTEQALKDRKMLEEFQRFLAPLHLPHHLQLRTEQCNMVNAFYRPDDRSLTLCYEIVADAINHAPKTVSVDGFITREAAIFGTVVGVLLHEGGHMMFDMLDVPRFGREEDAADETAAFLALQFNKDVARTIIKGFAYTWALGNDPTDRSEVSAWSDVHGSASQRMYNTLCLAYGGDPQTFKEFVDRGWLPKERAVGCAQEYNLVKRAFVKTILPFIDQALMARVQKAQWLSPEELK
jgi:hypothetical protein